MNERENFGYNIQDSKGIISGDDEWKDTILSIKIGKVLNQK